MLIKFMAVMRITRNILKNYTVNDNKVLTSKEMILFMTYLVGKLILLRV